MILFKIEEAASRTDISIFLSGVAVLLRDFMLCIIIILEYIRKLGITHNYRRRINSYNILAFYAKIVFWFG